MIKKMTKIWAVALVAVAMLMVGAPAGVMAGPVDPTGPDDPDSPRFGAIRGVVFDENREVVEGAVVILIHARSGEEVARAETGENGHFGFRKVKSGRYLIKAGKRDVGQGRAEVGVRRHVSRVKVVLHKR